MAQRRSRLLFLGNWPIARRLTLGFLLAALIAGAAAGLAGLTHAQALGTEAQLYRQILTANQYLDLADNNLLLMDPTLHNAIQDAQANQSSDLAIAQQSLHIMETQLGGALARYGREDLLTNQPNAHQVLVDAGQANLIGEQGQLFSSAQRTWGFYQQAQDQVLAAIAAGNASGASDYEHRQAEPTHSDAISALNSLLQFNRQLAEDVGTGISQEDSMGSLLSGLAALLAFIGILVVGWLVSRSISRPLHQLHQLTQTVSRGQFNSRAAVTTADEIGSVTQAVNGMLDTIVGLLYKTQDQRDVLTSRAEQLAGNLRGAGAGDLRIYAEESGDVVGKLANSFNLTLNRFRRFIRHSQATVEQIDMVANQIGERSGSLTRNARLEAARFTHLGAVAEALADYMRQAQQSATDAILHWRAVIEQVQAGKAAAERVIQETQRDLNLNGATNATATLLAQRTEELGEAANLAEEVARRAARVALTSQVQIAQLRERVPGLGMIAEELRSLSGQATEAAHQMGEAVSEARSIMRQAIDGINATSQEHAALIEWSVAVANEMSKALQASEAALAKQAKELTQLRASVSHAQAAEEMSRSARESGAFLQAAGAEAQKIAEAAEQLLQLDQRLFASLTPFKLADPSGPLPSKGRGVPVPERAITSG